MGSLSYALLQADYVVPLFMVSNWVFFIVHGKM